MPQIKINNTIVSEADGFAELQFSLTEASSQPISFSYSYSSGTASANSDFPTFSGQISFAPGSTMASLRLAIDNDSSVESLEMFLITFNSPINATLECTSATIGIVDNDATAGTPSVSVGNTVVDEKAGFAYFVVSLAMPASSETSVAYATQAGTALAGSDYVAQSGTLVFSAGETAKTIAVPISDDSVAENSENFSLVLSNPSGLSLADAVGYARIAVSDTPTSEAPHIRVANTVIGESDGFADVLFSLSAPSAQIVSVSYDYSYGSSGPGSDFPTFSGTLAFAPGETSKTLRLPVENDNTHETREDFLITLNTPINAKLERTSAVIGIVDNDATVGTPSISVSSCVLDEKDGVAEFVVTLDRPSFSNVSLSYATQDLQALAGSDYVAQSGNLVFRPGETSKTISVLITDDNLTENTESLKLVLSNAIGGNLADTVGVARIGHSDNAVVNMPQIKVANTTISEIDGYADIVFSLSAASNQTISVKYNYDSATAYAGIDFPNFSGSLSFAAGETTKVVRLAINDDIFHENIGCFRIELDPAINNATLERSSAVITVMDNNAPADTPSISVSSCDVDEKSGVAQFVITLDIPAFGDVAVNFATQDGTAIAGSDYFAQTGNLVFRTGETSKTVSVMLLDDSQAEGMEAFKLVLSNASGGNLAQTVGTARIALSDTSAVASPQIRVDSTTICERDGFADVVFSLTAPSAQTASVSYHYSPGTVRSDADSPDSPWFYGKIAFAPGETSKTLRLPIHNETDPEVVESFLITLFTPNYASLERTSAVVTIIDNDATAGTPEISISNCVVDEKAGVAQFVVSLNKPADSDVAVSFTTQDGEAKAGSDYVAQTGNLVFRSHETSKVISIVLSDDTTPESFESFKVQLTNATGATLANAVGSAQIGISDTNLQDVPQISIANTTVNEIDGFVDLLFHLSAPSAQIASVSYGFAYGSSSPSRDFPFFDGSLSFAPGETTKVLRLPIFDDNSYENTEGFWVVLNAPINATLERSLAVVTIIDNDATAGTPKISVSDCVVDEKAGLAHFYVTLDKPSFSAVSVPFTTKNATALAGLDYQAQTGTLVLRPGETAQTISIILNDDALLEANEIFHLALGTPSGATLADAIGTARIAASDAVAQDAPQIRVTDTMLSELDGFADVVFTLSGPSKHVVSVSYAYASGTASSDIDFPTFGLLSGKLSFAAGETSKTLRLPIYDDSSNESQETFTIKLMTPINATLERSSASITLLDNDSGINPLQYGMGNDIYEVTSSDRIYENVDGGTDLVRFTMADYVLESNIENAAGNSAVNRLTGNALNNQLSGLGGNDALEGGAGVDTAVFTGNRSSYTISKTASGFTVTDISGAEGVDTLSNVERVKFADSMLALDGDGAGGKAYRVYQAAFNRTPDGGGLGYWINAIDNGASVKDVASGFVNSAEYQALYGVNPSNAVIVNKYYENVLHRQPDSGGFNYWLGLLDQGALNKAEVLAFFSESPENQDALATIIGNGFVFTPYA